MTTEIKTSEPMPDELHRGLKIGSWLNGHPWIWVYFGSLLVWLGISAANGQVNLTVITAVFGLAPFLVLVGIGQMFVITLGNGHIDLSVPSVVSLSAFLSTQVIALSHGNLLVGFLATVALGLLVALLNTCVIVGLRVPPIVATLATGLIVQTASSVMASQGGALSDATFSGFTHWRIWGISVLSLCCIVIALIFGFVLHSTVYGRHTQAVGQSAEAARLSGITIGRTVLASYALSGVLAAIAGALLGAFASPTLDLGNPYLLNSIAVVVLGGSLISGGQSNLLGIWGSAMFLTLLNALLNTLNISIASQNIVQGTLIILVLALIGAGRRTRDT